MSGDLDITVPVVLHLQHPDGPIPLNAALGYRILDPFAVELAISDDDGVKTWVFARDILAAGLYGPAGVGDVHVWADSPGWVRVELAARHRDAAVCRVDAATLRVFIDLVYRRVPVGEELLDMDGFLADVAAEGDTAC